MLVDAVRWARVTMLTSKDEEAGYLAAISFFAVSRPAFPLIAACTLTAAPFSVARFDEAEPSISDWMLRATFAVAFTAPSVTFMAPSVTARVGSTINFIEPDDTASSMPKSGELGLLLVGVFSSLADASAAIQNGGIRPLSSPRDASH